MCICTHTVYLPGNVTTGSPHCSNRGGWWYLEQALVYSATAGTATGWSHASNGTPTVNTVNWPVTNANAHRWPKLQVPPVPLVFATPPSPAALQSPRVITGGPSAPQQVPIPPVTTSPSIPLAHPEESQTKASVTRSGFSSSSQLAYSQHLPTSTLLRIIFVSTLPSSAPVPPALRIAGSWPRAVARPASIFPSNLRTSPTTPSQRLIPFLAAPSSLAHNRRAAIVSHHLPPRPRPSLSIQGRCSFGLPASPSGNRGRETIASRRDLFTETRRRLDRPRRLDDRLRSA